MAGKSGSAAKDPARRLADLLNLVFVAGFCLWVGFLASFWMQALGPMLPLDTPRVSLSAQPWLSGSVALAIATQYLPRVYYLPRGFEARRRFYEAIGVKWFRMAITNGDLVNRFVRRRHQNYVVNPGGRPLRGALRSSFEGEKPHLFFMVMGAGATIYAFLVGWTGWMLWFTVTNLVVNLYPILLQRYTRGRIWRISTHRRLVLQRWARNRR